MELARVYRTVRHLRLVQLANRLKRRLLRPRPTAGPAPAVRAIGSPPPAFVTRAAGWDGGDWIELIGRRGAMAGRAAWNDSSMPKLWLYHLHYFEDLLRPDSAAWHERHRSLIERWIRENPPVDGNGWEPYPIALRSVFWMKWAVSGGPLDVTMRDSLAIQLRHLENSLEFHLLGNHLWADAKALFFAGLFFEGSEAERWYERGRALLEAEREEQILGDGGHFERSPVYHCLILEDVLDLIAWSRAYSRELPPVWRETAVRMLDWLAVMTRPDGCAVAWNDAAGNAAPAPAELFAYAARLGLAPSASSSKIRHLTGTGYIRADHAPFTLWFDVGPVGPDYIPGHAHADTLNVEIFVGDRALVVDSGTSTYDPGPRRAYERGTEAHNTVTVNATDSSEMWGSFRVGRRARPLNAVAGPTQLSAAHDGYRHLGIIHSRTIGLEDGGSLRIADRVEGPAETATAHFYLAPGLTPRRDGNAVVTEVGTLRFDKAISIAVEPCEIALGFNRLARSFRVAIEFRNQLTTDITA